MPLDLQTLKCAECGSSVLTRTGLNQYVCAHCGAVSVVEDDVSERLDRVLEQVKDAAAERLAAEQASSATTRRHHLLIVAATFAFVILVGTAAALLTTGPKRSAPVAADILRPAVERPIPSEGLRLEGARQVLVGDSRSARPRVFVLLRNSTGRALESPRVDALFFDGDERVGQRSDSVPLNVLAPGETVPMLIELPGERSVTRQELSVSRLTAANSAVEGPRLAFSRVRLVDQKDQLRLVGRVVNQPQAGSMAGIQALVVLYDKAGAVIGLGRGYAQASQLAPGERTAVEVRIDGFGAAAAARVAAWDYRLDYSLLGPDGRRSNVVAPDRVIRTEGGPERFHPDLRIGTDDLLADESERFDLSRLELLAPIPGFDTVRRRSYMSELVNRSADTIALTPAAVISQFDGNAAVGSVRLDGPAYLYPGERYPVQLDPGRAGRITQTRIEWKPVRRAALPGPRTPLEVRVTGTKAETGSVLLNFSQRFTYKSVEVSGEVRNPGAGIVRKVRLWVSLRDERGRLSGFALVDDLPALGPGESAPFQVDVKQQGDDFASVTTLYQTTQ